MNIRDYTEFEKPLSMLLDGTLSPDQKQALQDQLETDAGFRRFYFEYMKIHTLLRGELEGRRLEDLPADIDGIQSLYADEPEYVDAVASPDGQATSQTANIAQPHSSDTHSRSKHITNRFSGASRYFSIAAGFLIVAVSLFWMVQQLDSQGPMLASVTDSHGAYWESATGNPGINPEVLSADEYDLRVGQLELTFHDGTVATLDAPVHFALHAENHLHLTRGRVYVIAQEGTSGFRVSTPDALAVDLGTEFGVAYDSGRATQVHVFKGAVNISESRLDTLDEPVPVGETLTLVEKQAGLIKLGAGPALDTAADMSLFVRDISSLADADPPKPTLNAWRAYRDRLASDPDLVAAYDFTRRSRTSTSLTNIAHATGSQMNGVLGDESLPDSAPKWTTGRFPGSHALLFNPTDKQFVGLPEDDALKIKGDLTTAWWMMPRSTIHRDFSMVVLGYGGPREDHAPETAQENHLYAHGLKLGRIRAFHESQAGENQEVLATPKVKPDVWTHVAIVRDTAAMKYHVYLNGQLADSLAYNRNVTGGDSPDAFAAIGRSGGARLNHFDGKLDELMIYSRALTELEVTDLYQRSRHHMQ